MTFPPTDLLFHKMEKNICQKRFIVFAWEKHSIFSILIYLSAESELLRPNNYFRCKFCDLSLVKRLLIAKESACSNYNKENDEKKATKWNRKNRYRFSEVWRRQHLHNAMPCHHQNMNCKKFPILNRIFFFFAWRSSKKGAKILRA